MRADSEQNSGTNGPFVLRTNCFIFRGNWRREEAPPAQTRARTLRLVDDSFMNSTFTFKLKVRIQALLHRVSSVLIAAS